MLLFWIASPFPPLSFKINLAASNALDCVTAVRAILEAGIWLPPSVNTKLLDSTLPLKL